ncbi:MAG: bifunctional oligoribonuclease/PAP phosphatase NrnA [Candidatus Omnitrophica bacterium]|nr:bifunctional oligoribonuclease/PAP phosphatase NrnA [Candidatus Omnitrophota bacterium]
MLKKITDKIKKSKNFLITSHMSLEGDALGSELAVYALLKKLKKRAVVYNQDATPEIYSFLPNVRFIKNHIAEEHFDVGMILDCSDSSRTGKVKDALSCVGSIINIDHHISNTIFGDYNWVDAKAGSTCQMLYKLCDRLKVMDKNIALCLYTGIFTDTGNFTYANTTEETHRVVSNLMKYNIHPSRIDENLHSLCKPQDLMFISDIISSLKFDSRKQICWARIQRWEEKDYDLTEVVFSIMRLLKDIDVFILFKAIGKNKTRVNFRSRHIVDVNMIAKFFGGGGHKRASGTTVEDNLDAAERKVIPFVKRYTNGIKIGRKQ